MTVHVPDLRPVSASQLIVDPDVQRALDMRRVNDIAENLNFDALGTVTVSHRQNGSYHIIDGQHRVQAVRLVGGDDEKLLCRVFSGLTLAEEAEMFRLLNNTAKPQAADLFRVRVVEGDPDAVAIVQIIKRHGWSVGFGREGAIAAVAALERTYRRNPDALDHAVASITRSWGHGTPGNDGRLVEGIGMVYARYGSAVQVADMVPRLASFAGGPGALLGRAKGLQEMIGGNQPNAVAEIVVETYNRGRRTRALQPWRASR
jgi:hypothetical protein